MDTPKSYIIKGSSNINIFLKPFWITIFSILLTAGLGYVDYITGPYLSFQIFYLIPVGLALWLASRASSFVVLSISVAAWFIDDIEASLYSRHLLVPYWNLVAKVVFFLIFMFLLDMLKGALQREKLFARIDYLTEVSNRKNFFDLANREISRASRYKYQMTLMYLDLDDFKHINDTYGHNAGDEVLRLFAQTLNSSVRLSDMVARLGGDEFVVLFPETGFEASSGVIQRIRDNLSKVLKLNRWPVTFSIGAITCLDISFDLDTIMASADKLMYAVKKSGKNGIKYEILKGNAKSPTAASPEKNKS
jgi:diguanylate cyclase (GGDEF)-like protein